MKPIRHLEISPFFGRRAATLSRWKRLVLHLLPMHVIPQWRDELRMTWVRWFAHTPARKFRGATDLKLNLGSGSRGHDGWVNLDFLPMKSVNCVWDCRRSLPFDDGSVRFIFSEHVFEHLDYTEEIPAVLSECLRVLQPGGILRIVVPDAGRYLRAYCEPGWDALTQLRDLRADHFDRYTICAYGTKMELINEVFRQAYTHKFAYDHETLERVLLHSGFARTERSRFGVSLDPELAIDFADRAHESLYIEGVKAR